MLNNTSNYSLDEYIPWDDSVVNRLTIFLSIISLCLSTISLIVLIDFKEKLFAYLKIEQIWIILNTFINSFNLIFWIWKQLEHTILWPIFFKFFQVYMASTCELCAFVCTIISAIIFMSIIDKKWDFYVLKLSPYIIILIIALLSFALFSFQLFQFDIKFYSSHYIVVKNMKNFFSTTFKVIEVTAFTIRDGIFLILLFVLNYFLYRKFRICMENKRKMVKYSQPTVGIKTNTAINSNNREKLNTTSSANQIQAEKAKNSMNKMILFCCLNSTFERFPIFLAFLLKNITGNDNEAFFIMIKVATIMVRTAYILKFFIYYYFNHRFRVKFIGIFFKNRIAKVIFKNKNSQ